MDLSVIIVNWNSKEYVRKCLASLLAHTSAIEYEVIVIDSASHDGCDGMLKELYPAVRFIQSDTNLGFAGANNTAYAAAQGKCILFLNPDTEVQGRAVKVMFEQLNALPDAGSVGTRLLNSDGSLQTSCIQSIPTILNQLLDSEALRAKWPRSGLWGMAPLYNESVRPQEVEAISGACVMVKRSAFDQVGLFSEDYFMYAEDIDLSYKIRRAGYRNYYLPEAVVVHHGGGSSKQALSNFSVVMMREATWRFMRKTRGECYGWAYRASMLMAACGRIVLLLLCLPKEWISPRGGWTASLGKWRAILRWSLNREAWVKQYYPS